MPLTKGAVSAGPVAPGVHRLTGSAQRSPADPDGPTTLTTPPRARPVLDRSLRWRATEVVPLAERLRYVRVLRLTLVLVVSVALAAGPGSLRHPVAPVWPATLGYLGMLGLSDGWARRRGGRGLRRRRGALLLFDAAYLVWVSDATGGLTSPLRFLIVIHLVSVVLLSSYRSGVKLAIWDCLLLVLGYHGAPGRVGGGAVGAPPSGELRLQLVGFLLFICVITLVTAGAAAVSERELRRRRCDLEALTTLASELERATDVESIGERLLASLSESFELERLVLVGPGPEPLLEARSATVTRAALPQPIGPRSLVARAAADRSTRLLSRLNPADDPWLAALLPGARDVVAVPLTAEGQAIAVLVLEHPQRLGSGAQPRSLAMIERFAAHAALALRNARLLEQVRRVAAVDGLTAIPNRRTFETELERETARSARSGAPLGLVMLDIDHFKALNDGHGHLMGDEVLQQVAALLAEACRDFDIAARYGGEEFAVLVPGCDREATRAAAHRLHKAVRRGVTSVPVTASVGYATFPLDAQAGRDLVEVADRAMYAAKQAGRDRVWGPPVRSADDATG